MQGRREPDVPRWPRFRFDEVVRVIDAARGPEQDERLLESNNREGIVESLMPDRKGRGWVVYVRFGEPIESGSCEDAENFSRHFWESQLESTGYLERDGARVPLDPHAHAESFVELSVRLFVARTKEPLEQLLDRAEAACRQLLPTVRIDTRGRVDQQYADHWWIWLEIRPKESSRDAFERLAAAFEHWQAQWDNGWTTDFAWYRKGAAPGEEGFLLPEADSVFVTLFPYGDPTYRPVPRGRNQGLTKFEQQLAGLPPPAGYEAPTFQDN
jgi:hypothetical protein